MSVDGGSPITAIRNGRAFGTAEPRSADSWAFFTSAVLTLVVLAGCSVTREVSKSPRTAVEQLLLSQALERSLKAVTLPIPDGASVYVEAATLSADQKFVEQVVAGQLGRLGLRVMKPEEAIYRVRVLVQGFGTEQGTGFFGMPPVQSVLLPFALPEIALYKHVHQDALVRLSLELSEMAAGRFISSTPWYAASAYHDQYTVLFFFTFSTTDLEVPA